MVLRSRRHSKKSRRHRKVHKKTRNHRIYGGGIKEEALKVIKNSGTSPYQLLYELLNSGTTRTIGGFDFKGVGHVNLYLYAKPTGSNDSQYVEIYFMSDH